MKLKIAAQGRFAASAGLTLVSSGCCTRCNKQMVAVVKRKEKERGFASKEETLSVTFHLVSKARQALISIKDTREREREAEEWNSGLDAVKEAKLKQ